MSVLFGLIYFCFDYVYVYEILEKNIGMLHIKVNIAGFEHMPYINYATLIFKCNLIYL